jgi:hypothetical protein
VVMIDHAQSTTGSHDVQALLRPSFMQTIILAPAN